VSSQDWRRRSLKHLRFWWPGAKYQAEFGNGDEARGRRRKEWDPKTVLDALNECKSVQKAARKLKTTPITLTKAIERHGIQVEWRLKAP
jgi:transcriptional regulator with GAF, ATPase, and Fis domain